MKITPTTSYVIFHLTSIRELDSSNTNILVLSSIKDILSQQLKLALFHLNGILLYAEMS